MDPRLHPADCARIVGPLFGAAMMTALGIGPVYVAATLFHAGGLALTAMGGTGLAHRREAGAARHPSRGRPSEA